MTLYKNAVQLAGLAAVSATLLAPNAIGLTIPKAPKYQNNAYTQTCPADEKLNRLFMKSYSNKHKTVPVNNSTIEHVLYQQVQKAKAQGLKGSYVQVFEVSEQLRKDRVKTKQIRTNYPLDLGHIHAELRAVNCIEQKVMSAASYSDKQSTFQISPISYVLHRASDVNCNTATCYQEFEEAVVPGMIKAMYDDVSKELIFGGVSFGLLVFSLAGMGAYSSSRRRESNPKPIKQKLSNTLVDYQNIFLDASERHHEQIQDNTEQCVRFVKESEKLFVKTEDILTKMRNNEEIPISQRNNFLLAVNYFEDRFAAKIPNQSDYSQIKNGIVTVFSKVKRLFHQKDTFTWTSQSA